jgi:hypothetical protein
MTSTGTITLPGITEAVTDLGIPAGTTEWGSLYFFLLGIIQAEN